METYRESLITAAGEFSEDLMRWLHVPSLERIKDINPLIPEEGLSPDLIACRKSAGKLSRILSLTVARTPTAAGSLYDFLSEIPPKSQTVRGVLSLVAAIASGQIKQEREVPVEPSLKSMANTGRMKEEERQPKKAALAEIIRDEPALRSNYAALAARVGISKITARRWVALENAKDHDAGTQSDSRE